MYVVVMDSMPARTKRAVFLGFPPLKPSMFSHMCNMAIMNMYIVARTDAPTRVYPAMFTASFPNAIMSILLLVRLPGKKMFILLRQFKLVKALIIMMSYLYSWMRLYVIEN